jgi:hypothetical protein
MKYFLVLICLAGALSSFLPTRPTPAKLGAPTPQDVRHFLVGYLVALGFEDFVPNGFPCASNLEDLRDVSKKAYELIKEGEFAEVVEAIEMVATQLNRTRSVCLAAENEGRETFRTFLEELKDPAFIKNALVRLFDNWRTVARDLDSGYQELINGSYYQSGFDFGSILHLVLSGPETEVITFIIDELNKLGSVVWPFKNCGDANAPLEPTNVVMDTAPAKGSPAGINIQGNVNADASVAKVQIATKLYGWTLNTQYDNWSASLQQGDALSYKFSVSIPSFAPSGPYSVSLTFQDNSGAALGCASVDFHL